MKEAIFKETMSQIPTNVAVVGSWEMERIRGCTISSLVSVDITDPTVMFVLKSGSATLANLKSYLNFSVNVLSSQQANLSLIYSNSMNEDEALENTHFWDTSKNGAPVIRNAHLSLLCRFHSSQELKNSTLVFAKVLEVFKHKSGNPLLYFERNYFSIKLD